MRNSRAIGILAGVTTVSAFAALCYSTCVLPPRTDPAPHRAAGRLLAREALGLLKAGGQVTVITRDTVDFPQRAIEIQFESFRQALREQRTTITTVRALEVDPLRPLEVPPGDFYELIRKGPAGSVIVSLMGPPLLTEDQRNQLGEIKAKIVAFCPGNPPARMDLRPLFEQRVLDVAIVSRSKKRRLSGGNQNSPDNPWFQTVTAENVGSLYAEAETGR